MPPPRFPGGHLPPIGPVLNETLTVFMRDLGPYALAGLGHLLIVLPLAFGVGLAMYAVIMVVVFGGMFGAALMAEGGSEQGAAAMALALVALTVLLVFGMVGVLNAILAPVQGSLYRAVARFQRGEEQLGFGSAFSSLGTNLVGGIVAMTLVMTLVLVGASFCYFPALVVALFVPWTFSLVALHGVGPVAALRRSVSHARQHFKWHLGFFGYTLLVSLVANNIPLVGPMFAIAFHIRVYREVFGDAEQAVQTLAA
jgi:hypothetical protein